MSASPKVQKLLQHWFDKQPVFEITLSGPAATTSKKENLTTAHGLFYLGPNATRTDESQPGERMILFRAGESPAQIATGLESQGWTGVDVEFNSGTAEITITVDQKSLDPESTGKIQSQIPGGDPLSVIYDHRGPIFHHGIGTVRLKTRAKFKPADLQTAADIQPGIITRARKGDRPLSQQALAALLTVLPDIRDQRDLLHAWLQDALQEPAAHVSNLDEIIEMISANRSQQKHPR
jgi:hypothetical protein